MKDTISLPAVCLLQAVIISKKTIFYIICICQSLSELLLDVFSFKDNIHYRILLDVGQFPTCHLGTCDATEVKSSELGTIKAYFVQLTVEYMQHSQQSTGVTHYWPKGCMSQMLY